jgi:hypothetical protein
MTRGNQAWHELPADRARRTCHKHSHHQLLDRPLPAPHETRQHPGCDTSEHLDLNTVEFYTVDIVRQGNGAASRSPDSGPGQSHS